MCSAESWGLRRYICSVRYILTIEETPVIFAGRPRVFVLGQKYYWPSDGSLTALIIDNLRPSIFNGILTKNLLMRGPMVHSLGTVDLVPGSTDGRCEVIS